MDALGRRLLIAAAFLLVCVAPAQAQRTWAVRSNWSTWTAPLGVPTPFALATTNLPSSATECPSWPNDDTGCYYIDNTSSSPACSDAHARGYPNAPRCTFQATTYAAGSYIEIRGGPYSRGASNFVLNGVDGNPVWVVGIGQPQFTGTSDVQFQFRGTGYYVVDGFKFSRIRVQFGQSATANGGSHYIAFRNNQMTGWTGTSASSIVNPAASFTSESDGGSNHAYLNNYIHHNGASVPLTAEADVHMFKISTNAYTDHVWITDNEGTENSGDCAQFGTASSGIASSAWPSFIYFGRNDCYRNGENAVDIKNARDVIVTQNIASDYDNDPHREIAGECFVVHDDAIRSWFLFNLCYDAVEGIDEADSVDSRIIGNIFRGITDGNAANDDNPSAPTTILGAAIVASAGTFITNNTVVNCDIGIVLDGGAGNGYIVGNIVGPLNADGSALFFRTDAAQHTNSTVTHNLFPTTATWTGARVQITTTSWYASLTDYTTAHATKCSGCLEGDAAFVNAAGNDFTIGSTSAAKDVSTADPGGMAAEYEGLYGVSIAKDHAGTIRPQGSAWDMGYHEISGGNTTRLPFIRREH